MKTIKVRKDEYQEIKVPAWFKFIRPSVAFSQYYQIDESGDCMMIQNDNGRISIDEKINPEICTYKSERSSKDEFHGAVILAVETLTKRYIT